MKNQITKPADLATDRYVTLAERKAYQDAMDDYNANVRAQAEKAKAKQNPEPAPTAPRYLSNEEYDELRRAEWEAQREKDKAREDAEEAKQKAREDYLASDDDAIKVLETNPNSFVLTFQHFVQRGYQLSDAGLEQFHPGFTGIGCFQCTMVKPTTTKKTSK